MKLEQAKSQILPGVVTPSKKQAPAKTTPLQAKAATPAQLQRSKNKLEQDRSQIQRQAEQASIQRESRATIENQARVQRVQDQAVALEQQSRVQRLADTQARQQSFFSSFVKSPVQRKSQQQVKTSSVQTAQARDQYQAAVQPEILQRLVDDRLSLQSQQTRAAQPKNDLNARAEWFNTELPVLRAKHNHPDTPFLDTSSVFKPTDQQAFSLGKTYGIQRLSSGLTTTDAASAILNIQRKADRDVAMRGLLTGINPRQSDYTSIQRLVAEGEAKLEIQRQALLENHEIQRQALQMARDEANPTNTNSGISEKINAKRGSGDPLPTNVRPQLEAGLNVNLEAVRVHTDAEADLLAKSVNAIAFTTGKDIFFSSGSYQPNTKSGYELIAHEVTHTVQQSQNQVSSGVDPSPSLERDAQARGAELAAKFDPNATTGTTQPKTTSASSSGASLAGHSTDVLQASRNEVTVPRLEFSRLSIVQRAPASSSATSELYAEIVLKNPNARGRELEIEILMTFYQFPNKETANEILDYVRSKFNRTGIRPGERFPWEKGQTVQRFYISEQDDQFYKQEARNAIAAINRKNAQDERIQASYSNLSEAERSYFDDFFNNLVKKGTVRGTIDAVNRRYTELTKRPPNRNTLLWIALRNDHIYQNFKQVRGELEELKNPTKPKFPKATTVKAVQTGDSLFFIFATGGEYPLFLSSTKQRSQEELDTSASLAQVAADYADKEWLKTHKGQKIGKDARDSGEWKELFSNEYGRVYKIAYGQELGSGGRDVKRQDQPYAYGDNTEGISSNNTEKVVASGTKINYRVSLPSDVARKSAKYHWYIINDPTTEQGKRNPIRESQQTGSTWQGLEWYYNGKYELICDVDVAGRQLRYSLSQEVRKGYVPSASNQTRQEGSPTTSRKQEGNSGFTGRTGGVISNPPVKGYDSPDSSSRSLELPAGITFTITKELEGNWLEIKLKNSDGLLFVDKNMVTRAPDKDARLFQIQKDQPAIGIAELFFKDFIKRDEDLRFYVNILHHINPKSMPNPSGDDWKDVKTLEDYWIWIPSVTFAQSLKGVVKSGSVKGELYDAVGKAAANVVRTTIAQLPGGKDVLKTLDEIGSSALNVFNNPEAFVNNLTKAVKTGFTQFTGDIGTYLQRGMVSVVTGQLKGQVDISKGFTPEGMLDIGLQLLDLTPKYLQGQIENKVPGGMKAVQGVKEAANLFSSIQKQGLAPTITSKSYFEAADTLKDQIFESLKDWAQKALVTKALEVLASSLLPGAGIIQAAIKIYETLIFIGEKFKLIKDTVKAITGSLADIANGNISGAVEKIVQSLAGGLSLAINFFVKISGLGGIADRIREFFKNIRKKVDAAIDKVLAYFTRLVKPGAKPINPQPTQKPGQPNNQPETYKLSVDINPQKQKPHKLILEGTGASATLKIQSKPKTYAEFVETIRTNFQPPAGSALSNLIARADKAARLIEIAKSKAKSGDDPNYARMIKLMNALAKIIEDILTNAATNPPSVVEYGDLNSGQQATSMRAKILSSNFIQGTVPTEESIVMKTIKANRKLGRNIKYVLGHLLNHNIGGKGDLYNLTVISRKANSSHQKEVESNVKTAISSGKVIEYNVKPTYAPELPMSGNQRSLKSQIDASSSPNSPATVELQRKFDIMEYERKNLAFSLNTSWRELQFDSDDFKWNPLTAFQRKNINNSLDEDIPA
jgi:Domain of unknown function (DUF4157)/DNA/RNA non-specific endonuclease